MWDPRSGARWVALAVVAAAVVALDQSTKEVVRSTLEPARDLHALGPFSLELLRNPGIAGGGLAGRAVPLALLATLAVGAMLAYLVRRGIAGLSVVVGFGLLIGGGLGNLTDRVRLGYVTDFIVQGDRAFNVADVAIFAGGAVILVGLLSLVPRAQPRLDSSSSD